VPVEFSVGLHARLVETAKPVELYTYKGDDHNISDNFGTAMQRSAQFFDKHVKGLSD
jgi:fermentation-respiration switch protein FrsA (DUF1100 family)